MIRTFWLPVAVLALAGCSVGEGDGNDNIPDAPTTPPDVPVEVAALCSAQIAVTGTFTAAAPLDPLGGCQPQGTWQVTATVSDKGTCSTVPLKNSYSYTLTGSGRNVAIAYSSANGEEFQGAVSASGSGGCEGSFEHILSDSGKFDQLNLHAFLPKPTAADTELAITGTGAFLLWGQHP